MSRTLPTECAHGAICDWGDFGGDNLLPEHCPHGCNDDLPAPPLTDAAEAIARLAEIVKELEWQRDSARSIAAALEAQNAAALDVARTETATWAAIYPDGTGSRSLRAVVAALTGGEGA